MQTSQTENTRSVADWAVIARLSEESRRQALLASDPRAFAERLAGSGQPVDGVRFLAHLLPKREGVWWAWWCAKQILPANPPAKLAASLAATERWIGQPNDENRRAAMTAAQEAEVGTPAGAAGLAAFLSGESLAPAGAPPVPPSEFLSGNAVAASIILSAVASEPEKAAKKYNDFLVRGFEVANRIQLWERMTGPPGQER